MAITKIHAIKSTLGKALAYIENPDKTDGQMLVSGYNCEPQTASIDFEITAVLAHKARNLKRKRSTINRSLQLADDCGRCRHKACQFCRLTGA